MHGAAEGRDIWCMGSCVFRKNRRSGLGDTFHRFHKVTYFFLRTDVTLTEQLVIGCLHGDFTDLQVLGKGPFGGELFSAFQISGENVAADTAIECLVQWYTRGFF